jgi:hypothetical protein
MEEHETRRKIIREWMKLPKDSRRTEEQVAAFAKGAVQQNGFQRSRLCKKPLIWEVRLRPGADTPRLARDCRQRASRQRFSPGIAGGLSRIIGIALGVKEITRFVSGARST